MDATIEDFLKAKFSAETMHAGTFDYTKVPGFLRRYPALDEFPDLKARIMDAMPVLQRAIELRNPYVDSLSELQVRLLAQARALEPGDTQRLELERLVALTISGVAAGVQSTG